MWKELDCCRLTQQFKASEVRHVNMQPLLPMTRHQRRNYLKSLHQSMVSCWIPQNTSSRIHSGILSLYRSWANEIIIKMSFQLKQSSSTPRSSCAGSLKTLYTPKEKWALISGGRERLSICFTDDPKEFCYRNRFFSRVNWPTPLCLLFFTIDQQNLFIKISNSG